LKALMLKLGALATLSLTLSACGDMTPDPQDTAMSRAQSRADNGEYYNPKNNLDRTNYNHRLQMADDPTAIIWCTFFPFGNTGPITFPVVGKMTSGSKRPYPTEKDYDGSTMGGFYPELPGPDGMYGSSGDYRYGFGPDGVYHDVYGLSTYCTSQPMVYRQQPSGMNIVIVDQRLAQASSQARQALKAGQNGDNISPEALANANRILTDAINGK